MRFTGEFADVSLDYATNRLKIAFYASERYVLDSLNEIKNLDKLTIEAKKYREKRSLNANAYAWELITQIANELRCSKEEVYMKMLEDYGQSMLIPVPKGEKPDGYFKYYIYQASSILNGKEADWYKVLKGSSEFDTREMSILIDGIVSEAKDLGIETMTPDDLTRLKEGWE